MKCILFKLRFWCGVILFRDTDDDDNDVVAGVTADDSTAVDAIAYYSYSSSSGALLRPPGRDEPLNIL